MALKNRIVEIAYKLKDDFSSRVRGVTSSFRQVDDAAGRSDKAINRFNKRLGGVSKGARIAGTAIKATLVGGMLALVGAVGAAVSGMGRFREQLDGVAKSARALGETTETMTALGHAAALSGLQVRQLIKGMQQQVRTASEAADGVGEAAGAYAELGLNAAELEKLRPSEQLLKIARAMGEIQNQSDKVRLAERIFGARNAQGFLTLMEQGADGIKRMADEAKRLGIAFNDSQAAKIEKYNDNWERLSRTWDGLLAQGRLKFAGFFNGLVENLGGQGLITSANNLETVNAEIARLQETLDKVKQNQNIPILGGLVSDTRLRELASRMRELVDLRTKLLADQNAEKAQADLERKERAHNRRMEALYKEGTNALKGALKEREQALKRNLAQLSSLQAKQKAIAEEFASFVQDIQAGAGEQGAPDIIDTAAQRLEAQKALTSGDFGDAVKKARQASEMVRQMKEAGSESDIVLLGLAKSIERIANAAAAGQVKAKQGEIEQQKKAIEEIENRLKNLPKMKIQLDEQALSAELDRIQALVAQRPVLIKLKPEGVASFGSQADIERMINEEAMKRGTQ